MTACDKVVKVFSVRKNEDTFRARMLSQTKIQSKRGEAVKCAALLQYTIYQRRRRRAAIYDV